MKIASVSVFLETYNIPADFSHLRVGWMKTPVTCEVAIHESYRRIQFMHVSISHPFFNPWVTEGLTVSEYRANGPNLLWRNVSTVLIRFVALFLSFLPPPGVSHIACKVYVVFIVLCLEVWIFNVNFTKKPLSFGNVFVAAKQISYITYSLTHGVLTLTKSCVSLTEFDQIVC